MTPTSPGPAVRAVLDRYHAALTRYRRGVLVRRTVTIVLLLWVLASFAVPVFAGFNAPWYLRASPAAVLALWFLLRIRVQDALGVRYEPPFPVGLLEVAQTQDDAAARPRAFGSVPEGMRTYNPENW